MGYLLHLYYLILFQVVFFKIIASKNARERIAFIFAGSARSFILPPVRKTIQRNLILSFCPSISCSYDIFVRTSANDNNHVGINAAGEVKLASISDREDIRHAFRDIEPAASSKGHLYLSYYDINSKEEYELMKSFGNHDFHQRVYRELDARRYSMLFGRWKAYEKMLRQERISGQPYTWVVHARLDVAWSAPISSVHSFNRGKFYGPDCWHSEIPDTFSVMSRNLSDYFYSMEALMHPNILCLGGPNFDIHSLDHIRLAATGFNQTEINWIQQEDCRKKFPHSEIVAVPKLNTSWSTAGYSELFLKRKLETYGYDIINGGVKLMPLFMYIVRIPMKPYCFYLNSGSFISWLQSKQSYNAALFTTCIMANDDLRKYTDKHASRCAPLLDRTVNVISTGEELPHDHESCLLQPKYTDMNFLPFRLRSRNMCITSLPYHLNMSSCINTIYRYGLMQTYADEQLFYFYPLISTPQKIMQHTTITNKKLCLTAILSSSSSSLTSNHHIDVKFDDCALTSDKKYPSTQMFTIIRLNLTRLTSYDRSSNIDSLYTNLKPLTGILIQWQHPPHGEIYCLWHTSSSSSTTASSYGHAVLKRCSSYRNDIGVTGATLIAERTRTSTPYRPGITISSSLSKSTR